MEYNTEESDFDDLNDCCETATEISTNCNTPIRHNDTAPQTTITRLCDDIQQGIRKLNSTDLSKAEADIVSINSNTGDVYERSVQLFSRYQQDVDGLATSLNNSSKTENIRDDMSEIDFSSEVPLFLYEGTKDMITPKDALSRNIFWTRVLIAMFCLISMSCMASVPHINRVVVSAEHLIPRRCDEYFQHGSFDFTPYQMVLGLSVIGFVYSAAMCGVYLLPIDNLGQKYIPSFTVGQYTFPNGPVFFRTYGKVIELCADATLLLFFISAGVTAAVALEQPVEFRNDETLVFVQNCWYGVCPSGVCADHEGGCPGEDCDDDYVCPDGYCANPDGLCDGICEDDEKCPNGQCPGPDGDCPGEETDYWKYVRPGPDKTAYSLHTFGTTYGSMSPSCLDGAPVSKIQASLAMFFLAIICLGVALQISARSWYMQKLNKDVRTGARSVRLSDSSEHSNL